MTPHAVPDCVQQDLVAPVVSLSEHPGLRLPDLKALSQRIVLDAEQRAALQMPDPARPYGRRVIFANDALEAMVATWTRGRLCAPHDHGGSVGAVKVLQGRARHRVWAIEGGALVLRAEHTVAAGEILACGPDLIHSMGDDGGDEPLMTLHLYTDCIDFMVVYEPDADATHVVEGSCGAWVPHDTPALIRRTLPGTVHRRALVAARAGRDSPETIRGQA